MSKEQPKELNRAKSTKPAVKVGTLGAGSKGGSAAPVRQRKSGLKPVAALALPVLKPILARRSGMTIDLIAAWPAIVSEKHASYTLPEKINWPRRANEDDPFEPATLVIACDGAKAIFFQHELGWVIERVNSFFGYQAIARVKILQKPLHHLHKDREKRTSEIELDEESAARLQKTLKQIKDPDLKRKLEKLGKGVMSRNLKS